MVVSVKRNSDAVWPDLANILAFVRWFTQYWAKLWTYLEILNTVIEQNLSIWSYCAEAKRLSNIFQLYFARLMFYINSAINPILYNIMSSKFRNGFKRVFHCVQVCLPIHEALKRLRTKGYIIWTQYLRYLKIELIGR